jgi:hypothetical protein
MNNPVNNRALEAGGTRWQSLIRAASAFVAWMIGLAICRRLRSFGAWCSALDWRPSLDFYRDGRGREHLNLAVR